MLIAGPTCSGKSALAMDLAERLNGVVINADSMQVYRELRILTARPTQADEARIPHALYGIRPAADPGSAAWWRKAALTAMANTAAEGRLPILTGGTGLYFAALTQGLSAIPDIPEPARAEARALLAEHGPAALHTMLAQVDQATAARLRPSDSQRLARAWEVWRATGRGLAAWQSDPGDPAPWSFAAIRLDPPRDALRAAIATRFTQMLDSGALEEARAVQHLPPTLPAMRAHGVPELLSYLRGEIPLAEAEARATQATGQYTKRQSTWFRHRILAPPALTHTIHARYAGLEQFSESFSPEILAFVCGPG